MFNNLVNYIAEWQARTGVFRQTRGFSPNASEVNWLQKMVTIFHPPCYLYSLQSDFIAAPIKRWHLLSQLLKLVWPCDLLWPIEWSTVEMHKFCWASRGHLLFYIFFWKLPLPPETSLGYSLPEEPSYPSRSHSRPDYWQTKPRQTSEPQPNQQGCRYLS